MRLSIEVPAPQDPGIAGTYPGMPFWILGEPWCSPGYSLGRAGAISLCIPGQVPAPLPRAQCGSPGIAPHSPGPRGATLLVKPEALQFIYAGIDCMMYGRNKSTALPCATKTARDIVIFKDLSCLNMNSAVYKL
jgi:hypothetical protein